MKNIFLALVTAIGLSGCASYEGRIDYPYYHYSCINYNNEVVCGNHYYSREGIVYYYDSKRSRWIGHEYYRHYEPKEVESHDRGKYR